MKKISLIKRYSMYLIRWQLSTPILAPIVAMCKHSDTIFGTTADWIGATIANFVGGLIFFWVDRFIFYHKIENPIWEVKEDVICTDCNRQSRGYRVIQTPDGYDRIHDKNPEFRCEQCSSIKFKKLCKMD